MYKHPHFSILVCTVVSAHKHQLADASMQEVRQALSMPDPEHELWAGMNKKHRVVVLLAAGLPVDRQDEPWEAFDPVHQQKMCDQIREFGRISKRLAAIRWKG